MLVDAAFGPRPEILPEHGFTILAALLDPAARGTVRLFDTNPTTAPLIDPRFYSEPQDWEAMLHGMRKAAELGRAAPLVRLVKPGGRPSMDGWDAKTMEDFVRRNSDTYNHSVGTCRMGTDNMAVVDERLRLRGLDRLRILDSSVIPRIPSANTNATVLALAERGAALIHEPRLPRRPIGS